MPPLRTYFYQVDLRGRVFLDDVARRTEATAMRDRVFLNRLFERLRPSHHHQAAEYDTIDYNKFQWVSRCGNELNFIRSDDEQTPLVFKDLIHSGNSDEYHFLFAGDLLEPFDPSRIVSHRATNRVYFDRSKDKFPRLGLIHPHLALQFAEKQFEWSSNGKELCFIFQGIKHPCQVLE